MFLSRASALLAAALLLLCVGVPVAQAGTSFSPDAALWQRAASMAAQKQSLVTDEWYASWGYFSPAWHNTEGQFNGDTYDQLNAMVQAV
jgi:hypothetical protein